MRSVFPSASCVVLAIVLLPLLLLSFLVFDINSKVSNSWHMKSMEISDATKGKEKHIRYQIDIAAGNETPSFDGEDEIDPPEYLHSGKVSLVPISPVAAPTPAPKPAEQNLKNSEEKNITTPVTSKKERRKDMKLERLELGLSKARAAILEAVKNSSKISLVADEDYVPQGPVYRNANAFHRSYLEMEKLFRVYVYEEGEPPLFHDGPAKSIYSMEGRFIFTMEMGNKLRTMDPDKAHVFFLPFSVAWMIRFLYNRKSFDISPLKRTAMDYINVVSTKYPYWNRSLGADHFMLSCHDWGPQIAESTPHLHRNSIHVLCNANTSEGFNPSKDATLPEINLQSGDLTGIVGGPSPSRRPILAFFAGGLHGHIRSLLLNQWQNKDEDIQVHLRLPQGVNYYDMMRKSKYCLCPSGYEVASPRIVEAMYLECVPVLISDSYVLPFSDVLDWKSFSVQVEVKDIGELKNILMRITPRQYIRMQRRVKIAQKHFMINSPPKRYDVFHMILHSIWLRRLNVRVQVGG